MEPKRIKLDEFLIKWNECCVCGERGSNGMTNVFNLSLRQNESVVSSFVDILEFALSLKIQVGASDICANCKQKTIEFYHFKRRSHVKNRPLMSIDSSDVSSLAQDSMKIVDMYIKKFSIKALRIEESDETLIIMRKPPHEKLPNEHGTEVVPFLAIKQEPIENSPSNLFSPKNEPAAGDICIQIKIEPDLIIEDIGEDSMDSRPVNSPVQTTAEPKEHSPKDQQIQSTQETNPNQIEILLNMNQQILELIQEINSKVENLGQNVSRVEKMYESDEDFEPSGKLVDLPDNLKCDTLTEVLNLNRILQFQDNQEKLERILKLRLAAFRENYKLLLKEGLNILMSKPTQYLICPDGQSVLKTSRAVTSLLKITNEIFGIPMKHIERYIYHQLFTKKSIT